MSKEKKDEGGLKLQPRNIKQGTSKLWTEPKLQQLKQERDKKTEEVQAKKAPVSQRQQPIHKVNPAQEILEEKNKIRQDKRIKRVDVLIASMTLQDLVEKIRDLQLTGDMPFTDPKEEDGRKKLEEELRNLNNNKAVKEPISELFSIEALEPFWTPEKEKKLPTSTLNSVFNPTPLEVLNDLRTYQVVREKDERALAGNIEAYTALERDFQNLENVKNNERLSRSTTEMLFDSIGGDIVDKNKPKAFRYLPPEKEQQDPQAQKKPPHFVILMFDKNGQPVVINPSHTPIVLEQAQKQLIKQGILNEEQAEKLTIKNMPIGPKVAEEGLNGNLTQALITQNELTKLFKAQQQKPQSESVLEQYAEQYKKKELKDKTQEDIAAHDPGGKEWQQTKIRETIKSDKKKDEANKKEQGNLKKAREEKKLAKQKEEQKEEQPNVEEMTWEQLKNENNKDFWQKLTSQDMDRIEDSLRDINPKNPESKKAYFESNLALYTKLTKNMEEKNKNKDTEKENSELNKEIDILKERKEHWQEFVKNNNVPQGRVK
jgi:hypothetical protein